LHGDVSIHFPAFSAVVKMGLVLLLLQNGLDTSEL
jgi:hypothetical protein